MAVAAALALLGGCSLFRWSGYRDPGIVPGEWSAEELSISTKTAEGSPAAASLPVPDTLPRTLYYSDLGPAEIDVSSYPAQQKYNYGIFREVCARCHTLARPINAPPQSRAYWHYHLLRMSLRSRLKRQGPIPHATVKAVLDFLEYDEKARKLDDRARFEARTDELKRRFNPTLLRLLEHMQKSPQPTLIKPSPEP